MRKRNVHIQFWLNRKEAESLDKKVRRSGLSREAYLRHLIDGVVPQDAPPPDYFSMMRELYGIANNGDRGIRRRQRQHRGNHNHRYPNYTVYHGQP